MTETEPQDEHSGLLHSLGKHLPHHQHHPDTDDVTDSEEAVGFDLDTDSALPHAHHPDGNTFDRTRDLAYGQLPDDHDS
jgi:hypothetical protein